MGLVPEGGECHSDKHNRQESARPAKYSIGSVKYDRQNAEAATEEAKHRLLVREIRRTVYDRTCHAGDTQHEKRDGNAGKKCLFFFFS